MSNFLEFASKCPHRQACNVCDLPQVKGGCNEKECPEYGLIMNLKFPKIDIIESLEKVAEITGYTWIGKAAIQAMNEIKALRAEIQYLQQAAQTHTPKIEPDQQADQRQTSDQDIHGDVINHPEHKSSTLSELNNAQNQNENLPAQNDRHGNCEGGRE